MTTQTFKTNITSSTDIYLNADKSLITNILRNRDFVIISDEHVFELHKEFFVGTKYILIDSGESAKSLATVEDIIGKLVAFDIDRNSLIIGFGGGVVCDIAGFVGTIYMRGTPFGFIPTTLLSMVDAAIGGKNGVNMGKLKNYVGTISQPEFVLCDTTLLSTLPNEHLLSGMGEIMKYALLSDTAFCQMLVSNADIIVHKRPLALLNELITRCISFKINVIASDVADVGNRHILNFGHTFGHCYEVIKHLPHGIAVANGIVKATELSLQAGYCSKELTDYVRTLFNAYNFPRVDENCKNFDEILRKDKKKLKNNIKFVFLQDIGRPLIKVLDYDALIFLCHE